MSIIWLIIKVMLLIILIIFLSLTFILFMILAAPIKYDCLYEKYDNHYYQLRVNFINIIKAKFTLENERQESVIKLFGCNIYHHHYNRFDKVVEEVKDKVADTVQETSKEVIENEYKESKGLKKRSKVKENDVSKSFTAKWVVIKDLVLDERFGDFFRNSLRMLKRFFIWIKPYNIRFELIVGKDNPADTGMLISKMTLLYPWYYQYGIIEGNYEEEGLWGSISAAGKLHLIVLVKILFLFIMNKETRQYIHLILQTRKES